jgi:hypothetical protein
MTLFSSTLLRGRAIPRCVRGFSSRVPQVPVLHLGSRVPLGFSTRRRGRAMNPFFLSRPCPTRLEGALPFALAAKGRLLRSNAPNFLLFIPAEAEP